LELFIKNIGEKDCVCRALILPVTEGDKGLYADLSQSVPVIKRVLSDDFSGEKNEIFFIPYVEGMKPSGILFIGLGKKETVSSESLRQAGGKAVSFLRDRGVKNAGLSTVLISELNLSPFDFAEGALLGLYDYSRYKKDKKKGKTFETLTILSNTSDKNRRELEWTRIVASAVSFARDLVNAPANDMTPTLLAKAALSLKRKNLAVKVLEGKDARRLGMGSYLSVAKGSHEPPKFIVLEYKGGKGSPLALVGKSITFDSGGISLKPSEGMGKMKYDMAGGAAVLGAVKAISEAALPVPVVGILPATENLPGGSASKPGDIVRSMDGKTIEIISTDAEGRMALADAIGYAKRYKPRAIIDIATLTGACPIALGNEAIAMMSNNREFMDALKKISDATFERVWEMPLFEEYKEYVKSDVADLKNSGGKTGSLVSSAAFLSEFAGEVPWVHLDIAGTAWADKERPYVPKGASGIGVRLLSNYIRALK
jgi:leucyl aminopeptidase